MHIDYETIEHDLEQIVTKGSTLREVNKNHSLGSLKHYRVRIESFELVVSVNNRKEVVIREFSSLANRLFSRPI
ncbi:hypothetical protein Ciccas_002219 [Cichlidogyrus casuarinus]|uniref:Uncharacterized protein n=1 Tax=Cichlidogyrus casuarinus TaxID=1844966 RepID=A0ABD2QHV1_9PLAT